MLSIADVQWVLHHAPAPGAVAAKVDRGGEVVELSLALPDGWRRRGEIRVGTERGLRPGIKTVALTPEQRAAAGLADDQLGLLVHGVHPEWGKVAGRSFDSKRAGVRKNDIIVAVDGDRTGRTPSEFVAWFWQSTRPGQKVKLTVLRGGRSRDIAIAVP